MFQNKYLKRKKYYNKSRDKCSPQGYFDKELCMTFRSGAPLELGLSVIPAKFAIKSYKIHAKVIQSMLLP